ncbi:ABC transporter ATP-binding protein [Celerinatantimonas sp. MCCC 1A17872]|uniref:ABC transporter ATP-binding protein n=1 Tax=Celerinatantimonas sp. MCCC 1A17872 TaxID=3177514 RepID=UPI0038C95412
MHSVVINQLEKRYDQKTIFSDINLSIEGGEFLTLLGPSGCGKSTLLRCLAGLTDVDNGQIYLSDEDITNMAPQKRGIGMVFQSYALFPNLTVWENVAFGLRIQKQNDGNIKEKVERILALVELTEFKSRYPASLSGGQRQRVALARSLVVEPKVLLLDEPLSALDARIRKHLRRQIRSIQQELNLTTIFVTHDQEEALTMSDRIALMNAGQIMQCDTPERLYTEPANHFAASFMGQYNVLSNQQALQLLAINTEDEVAIRPESIYLYEASRQYPDYFSQKLNATVLSHQLLGTIIRYEVEIGDVQLTVDLLNRHAQRLIEPGKELHLLVDKSAIRYLKE